MSSKIQPPEFIKSLDALIRSGQIEEARVRLGGLMSPTRRDAPWLAEIARRTGQFELALKLLHRWVRPPERAKHREATSHELLEYGAALANLYALNEAREVLSSLDGRRTPMTYFFQALASIAEWDSTRAIEWLELFGAQKEIAPYPRLLGQVNLALSLLHARRWDEARALITQNIRSAREQGAGLLLTNSLECLTHLEYLSGSLTDAQSALQATLAVTLDAASPMRDAFYIEKWRILIAHRAKPSKYWRQAATALQARASQFGDHETARDIDFQLGRDLADPARLTRVYFGSPFPSYRQRILETASALRLEIPATWDWRPRSGVGGAEGLELFAVAASESLPGRLLQALCADHYRPRPLLALHERLYPGLHFNPRSSRDQMHQVFARLRALCAAGELNLRIEEHRGTYRLAGMQALRLQREESSLPELARVARGLMGDARFASRELAVKLGISKPTAVSRIQEWVAAGILVREGSGPGTRYRFVATSPGGAAEGAAEGAEEGAAGVSI